MEVQLLRRYSTSTAPKFCIRIYVLQARFAYSLWNMQNLGAVPPQVLCVPQGVRAASLVCRTYKTQALCFRKFYLLGLYGGTGHRFCRFHKRDLLSSSVEPTKLMPCTFGEMCSGVRVFGDR